MYESIAEFLKPHVVYLGLIALMAYTITITRKAFRVWRKKP